MSMSSSVAMWVNKKKRAEELADHHLLGLLDVSFCLPKYWLNIMIGPEGEQQSYICRKQSKHFLTSSHFWHTCSCSIYSLMSSKFEPRSVSDLFRYWIFTRAYLLHSVKPLMASPLNLVSEAFSSAAVVSLFVSIFLSLVAQSAL